MTKTNTTTLTEKALTDLLVDGLSPFVGQPYTQWNTQLMTDRIAEIIDKHLEFKPPELDIDVDINKKTGKVSIWVQEKQIRDALDECVDMGLIKEKYDE